MKEGVLHNKRGNVGYGDCSKYLPYSIESRVAGFGIQASVVVDRGLMVPRKVSSGVHSKQIYRLLRKCQKCIL